MHQWNPSALREERRARGWSQEELARQSGANRYTITGLEAGRQAPSTPTLCKLADALNVSVERLCLP